ncbi:uncharacterized protein [Anoplolepis gracilipes]|uniref:uncharacterized protein n=1 Tax=Anoplolepis gracilipes TaxID=354296 RepID=UPI003BA1791C
MFIVLNNHVTSSIWKKIFPSTTHLISVAINIFTTIVSTIMNFYHQEKLMMCIKKLGTVNDTLEQLGTPKAYRKMHIYSKRVLIGWILCSFIANFYDSLWLIITEGKIIWALCEPYLLNHCLNINAFIDFVFIFFLWYIGTRFDKVNEHMRYLLVNEKYVLKNKWKKSVIAPHRYVICDNNYKRKLWTLMHLHLELCHIARELNLIFGIQMTLEMASLITNITVMCFGVNILLMRENISLYEWFGISYWILIFIVRFYVINYICECVKIKAKKIEKIFHQLTNIIRYADIWKEIHQFILQAIQQPLKFTGMDFFYFGNDFLRKLCTTILMYVIIMIQMKVPLF